MNAFPADLPPSLDAPDAVQDHDWRAFCGLSSMENHWDRPGWTPDRRSYHWMLTFPGEVGLRQLVTQCQMFLEPAALDSVALDDLHLTLGRVAFTDELSIIDAYDAAERAVSKLEALTSFAITIGPLAGSAGAIRFSVAPWSPLLRLHRELAAATRSVLGSRCVMDTDSFRPHLSIAYANRATSVNSLIPLVRQARRLAQVGVSVASVQLVELRREKYAYRHEVKRDLPLGQS